MKDRGIGGSREIEGLKDYLDELVLRYNTEEFIERDPVRFPRRYRLLQDVEIVAFVVATIAWGRRELILRDAERMLSVMGCSPYDYVMSGGYEGLGRKNVHRTFFEHNLAYMLRGFRHFYLMNESMDAALGASGDASPQRLVEMLSLSAAEANGGRRDVRCYGSNIEKSALKRVNLALRWLVRKDGIVDMGVWRSLGPERLMMPLDVHSGAVSRELGLLSRRANDRRSVEELTARLREFRPDDPVVYDFALFGAGEERSRLRRGAQAEGCGLAGGGLPI